jgi:hypothetical protein
MTVSGREPRTSNTWSHYSVIAVAADDHDDGDDNNKAVMPILTTTDHGIHGENKLARLNLHCDVIMKLVMLLQTTATPIFEIRLFHSLSHMQEAHQQARPLQSAEHTVSRTVSTGQNGG